MMDSLVHKFLEPAHKHDPCHLSHIIELPQAILDQLGADSRASILTIQESTSILFASHERLTQLAEERLHRLVPDKYENLTPDTIEYSEPAFFNYVQQLRAEKEYLFEEALPDWKHKALRVDFGGQHELAFSTLHSHSTTSITLLKWWQGLQDAVDKWADAAEDVEIPDFEETVTEYRLFQVQERRRSEAQASRNRRRKTILGLERGSISPKLERVD